MIDIKSQVNHLTMKCRALKSEQNWEKVMETWEIFLEITELEIIFIEKYVENLQDETKI